MKENVRILLSKEDIAKRVSEMGAEISRDYAGKNLHMISILKGGVYFMTDLSRAISEDVPVTLDFMAVSSYGSGTKTSGVVRILKDLDETIEGKDVLIVEDIIDSGRTLSHLIELLGKRNPSSIKLCTLLNKPDRREVDVKVDYVGFDIEDLYVIGMGMDADQKYRNLPYIGVVENE